MNDPQKSLLDLFVAHYGSKYADLQPLGRGNRGVTYRAREVASGVDVVVKLPLDNLDVPGQRDFRVPRLAPSTQYAELFTVEPLTYQGAPVYAVISRYVQGVTWEVFVNRLPTLRLQEEPSNLSSWRLACSLIETSANLGLAVGSLHDQGFGHGDLHERNVLVVESPAESDSARASFDAILIDLGNASLASPRPEERETELIAKDVRGLRRLLLQLKRYVPYPQFWEDSLRQSAAVADIVALVSGYPEYLGGSVDAAPPTPDTKYYTDELRRLLAMQVSGNPPWRRRFRELLQEVADATNTGSALQEAEAALLHRIKTDPNYPAMSVTGRMTHVPAEDELRRLVALKSEPDGQT